MACPPLTAIPYLSYKDNIGLLNHFYCMLFSGWVLDIPFDHAAIII